MRHQGIQCKIEVSWPKQQDGWKKLEQLTLKVFSEKKSAKAYWATKF